MWLYTNVCKHFIRIEGDRRLACYAPLNVEQFKAVRANQIKPNTMAIELRSVRTIFTRARTLKVIRDNSFSDVSLVRVPKIIPAYMTLEQCRTLTEAVKIPILEVFYLFLFQTGAKRGEAIELEWKCVDIERPVVSLTKSNFTLRTPVLP